MALVVCGTSPIVDILEAVLLSFRGCAPVAQLDRASGYEPEGRGFESLRAHHKILQINWPPGRTRGGQSYFQARVTDPQFPLVSRLFRYDYSLHPSSVRRSSHAKVGKSQGGHLTVDREDFFPSSRMGYFNGRFISW